MNANAKLDWIYLEVAVCFGASFLNLPFGLFFLPYWIGGFFAGEPHMLPPILYTFGGVLGTIGIAATVYLIGVGDLPLECDGSSKRSYGWASQLLWFSRCKGDSSRQTRGRMVRGCA